MRLETRLYCQRSCTLRLHCSVRMPALQTAVRDLLDRDCGPAHGLPTLSKGGGTAMSSDFVFWGKNWSWAGFPIAFKVIAPYEYSSDEAAFTARRTSFSIPASTPGRTRTAVAPITISMIAASALVSAAGGAARTTGAKVTALLASVRSRAWRRQVNSCCGVNPLRRATRDTTAPGASVSSTTRALSSSENRRRLPVPVITSSPPANERPSPPAQAYKSS